MSSREGVLFTGAQVVTPSRVIPDGWVLVKGDRIVGVGEPGQQPPGASSGHEHAAAEQGREPGAGEVAIIDLGGRFLLPGLVDLHVHGGGTAAFDEGADAIRTAVATHRAHGTTRTMLSLITNDIPGMQSSIREAAGVANADPSILGLHLEGPFLSPLHRGAHDPSKLTDPNAAAVDALLAAGDGAIRTVTLAPELPGGPELIARLVASGIHAAVGHTDADYDTALAAFDVGADLVTHAFNAMRPLHHRNPGVIAAAMDAGVVLEAINDGVHLHNATVRLLQAVAPGRVAFVTDAMAAAGAADGRYRLGPLDVDVQGGVARLVEGGSIAGSTLTMDVAVRRGVQDVGMSVVGAVAAGSTIPARWIGRDAEFGSISVGRAADLVVADADLAVVAVMAGGDWVDARRP
jgi:N-acetylglucosamine-6-phosphate deacetylase